MCGLCGVFLTETHWTDASVATVNGGGRTRRHERLHRVALANRILQHYGLKVGDWQGSAYLLSSHTGRTAVVPSIAAVWPTAEQWRGRTLDPLDENLIADLEARVSPKREP
jgi:hypothetical protein